MLILSSHTHSQRKAVVVSTLAARRAGNKHAASAIAPNNDAVQRKVVSLILPRTFAGSTLFAHIIVKAPFSFSVAEIKSAVTMFAVLIILSLILISIGMFPP